MKERGQQSNWDSNLGPSVVGTLPVVSRKEPKKDMTAH